MEQLRFLICTKKIKLNRWWKRDTFHDVVIASTFIAFRSSFSVLERDGQLYHFWYSCSNVRGNPPNVVFLTQIGMLDFELIELKLPWVFCFFLEKLVCWLFKASTLSLTIRLGLFECHSSLWSFHCFYDFWHVPNLR